MRPLLRITPELSEDGTLRQRVQLRREPVLRWSDLVMPRTKLEARYDKHMAVENAEASGQVCDSMEVRLSIMARIKSGEITLAQGQAELGKIKRDGKRLGLLTRSQVYARA